MSGRVIKVSKNITLTLKNVDAITQMMEKTHKNFSFTVNYILTDWIEIRQKMFDMKEVANAQKQRDQQATEILKAKVIKE